MPKVDGLSPKQERFCKEYVVDFNGTQAAIRAGYSKKSAALISTENLRKPNIQETIQAEVNRLNEETGMTAAKIREELALLAFSDMSDYASFGPDGVVLKDSKEMDEGALRCVSEVSETVTKEGGTIRFKLHDKKGALVDLGKDFGMFKDKLEHSGTVAVEITEVAHSYPEEDE